MPENVTRAGEDARRRARARPRAGPDEKLATIKRGETLEQVLRANGAARRRRESVLVGAAARSCATRPLREGQRLKLLFGPSADARRADAAAARHAL